MCRRIFVLILFLVSTDTLRASSRVRLDCRPLPFEDLIRVQVVEEGEGVYLVLSQRDGEIYTRLSSNCLNLQRPQFELPSWQGETRRIELQNDGWYAVVCGPMKCERLPIQCALQPDWY